ncbi:lactate dehydrogenase [Pedobacter steynii]
MRVVAYSVDPDLKEPFAIANRKRNEITLIANSLRPRTAPYVEGKDAVSGDMIAACLLNQLAERGAKYITTYSADRSHIDELAMVQCNIRFANVSHDSLLGLLQSELPRAIALEND